MIKILFSLLLSLNLFASLHDKSAMVYYGENISYPMVGIHDYIIVEPQNIKTARHGFSVYKSKMYAYVSIGEIEKTRPEYKRIHPTWIIAKNRAWNSDVLDLSNQAYRDFLFNEMIEPQIKRGFENFFFDTLDSYQLAAKTDQERARAEKALVDFIYEFHHRYPESKLIINRGFEIIDEVHSIVEAVLFESYYQGLDGVDLEYKKVSSKDREWLDFYLNKIHRYKLPIICVEYLDTGTKEEIHRDAEMVQKKGMIPYVSTRTLDTYGYSSKNALKREILILVDESKNDIREQLEILNSGTVLEYMGYIPRFFNIYEGLPSMKEMQHYAGVTVWLQNYYKNPEEFKKWLQQVKKLGIKIAFVNNFSADQSSDYLSFLNINITKKRLKKIQSFYDEKTAAYEIEPSLSTSTEQIQSQYIKALVRYELEDGSESIPAAITSWGGYAIGESSLISFNDDSLWVVNPFLFFKEALQLKKLVVPDPTTENGKRLLFSHVDGDGIMNRVEGDFGYFAGDAILKHILKVYKIPHSVSVIGAEIAPNGIYPKISPKLMKIAKDIYALENVEPATHTFTHPFFWNKIKDDNLDEKYRLKPKGYNFSLKYELIDTLDFIEEKLQSKKEAKSVFWSGDCMPKGNVLKYVFEHNILNMNGGDTTITKTKPWLLGIAPFGIYRENYIQVFTGAQNENVYTNSWLGPFWGFKRVTQTFELTNSPRRFKPVDIYYHIYSGSKLASLKALEYVFDWALQADLMPIYTSEYIPKVMDFYTASLSNIADEWLVSGMKDLRTVRIEQKDEGLDLKNMTSAIGVKYFEEHTYVSFNKEQEHYLKVIDRDKMLQESYLIEANGKLNSYHKIKGNKEFTFESYVDLSLNFHIADGCHLNSRPKEHTRVLKAQNMMLKYKGVKSATVKVECE